VCVVDGRAGHVVWMRKKYSFSKLFRSVHLGDILV
jgi:hypothetical protein